MYYWHILNRDESELLSKFYRAQSLNPDVHDWVLQVKKDKLDLDIRLSDEEIKKLSKEDLKKIVRQQTYNVL